MTKILDSQLTDQNAYGHAYAYWAPLYRARWTLGSRRDNSASIAFAKRDVQETLSIWSGPEDRSSAYVGKLYAELDAIRDLESAHRLRKS